MNVSDTGAQIQALVESAMSEAQLKAVREVASGPRGRLEPNGPSALLLRSPDLMSRTQKVGEYLRFNSAPGRGGSTNSRF